LRSGGRVALSNLCAGPAGEPYFPVPWATTRDTSFLETPEAMRAGLAAAGFEIVAFRDVTAGVVEANRRFRDRPGQGNRPRIALEVLMDGRAPEMQRNSVRTLEEGRGLAVEALARKP
jgi:hypothetical protein